MFITSVLDLSCFLFQETQHDEDFHLKPTSTAGVLDTSKWPLLLKVRYLCNVYFHIHVNLLAFYHELCSLIGYSTQYLHVHVLCLDSEQL